MRLHRTLLSLLALCAVLGAPAVEKPRLIVTTDIGGDPDDQQSMVRLLLYANEFDIEALIASAAGTPGELSTAHTRPDLIQQMVDAYGQVQPNLALHASGYPTASTLSGRIKSGNKNRGLSYVGAGHDTPGSNMIISVVDKADSRPVNIAIWGGQTDLAQALWRVRNDRTQAQVDAFVAKIRVHDIMDQDGIYSWIIGTFPKLWYVLSQSQDGVKCESVYRGMFYRGDTSYVTKTWIDSHVKTNHGPLGALYPKDGLWTCGNGINGVKEGDTPSWFYFLPRGLNDPGRPDWGGWGGRFRWESVAWRDAKDTVGSETSRIATVWRWRPQYQNEFQARMDWCVKPFANANHSPIAKLDGVGGKGIVALTVTSGQTVNLSASGSSDPDGHSLSYRWWQYREAGSCSGAVSISGATSSAASFVAPSVSGESTIHIVLEVKDGGAPQLTSYRRAVITVQPATSGGGGGSATLPVSDDFADSSLHSMWQRTGDLPLAEQNGRIEVDTANGSDWRGGGLYLNQAVDLSQTVSFSLKVTVPDVSANQFAEMAATPALSFDSEGQPFNLVRFHIRGADYGVSRRDANGWTTLWTNPGAVSSGQTLAVELLLTSSTLELRVDGVTRFTGNHGLGGLDNGYVGFRAANKQDGAGGIARFDDFLLGHPPSGGTETAATAITGPASGTVFTPGQTVTATGTGDNLHWEIDRITDGVGAFASGSGGSITFTVPADTTEAQTIEIRLTGDGGTVEQSHAVRIPASGAYQESGGMVVIEAEHHDGAAAGSGSAAGSAWVLRTSASGWVGDGYVAAEPNSGVNVGDSTAGPRRDYRVDFATTGTWYLWVRMRGASGSDDSLHLGIDGAPASYGGLGMSDGSGAWVWVGSAGGARVAIQVASPGSRTVSLWMREDGVLADRILLTTDASYVPSGNGPAESVEGAGAFAAAINFQPASAVVPAGHVADSGAVFGDRGNGHSYGWNATTAETRDRNAHAEQRYDTLNHLQKPSNPQARWEIAVPNGIYQVELLCGDPSYTDQVNHLLVEGVRVADPDGQDHFDAHSLLVEVQDGRLSVAPAADAINAKLCSVSVTLVPSGGG